MAKRDKRRVKKRSKAHRKGVKKSRKRRLHRQRKVGFGTKRRRVKKARRK